MAKFAQLQLSPCFSTGVAQNDSEWPIYQICNFSNLSHQSASELLGTASFTQFTTFESFPTEVVPNDSEWPILSNLQLFQSFPTEEAQNDLDYGQFHLIYNFSNLIELKWFRMTR